MVPRETGNNTNADLKIFARTCFRLVLTQLQIRGKFVLQHFKMLKGLGEGLVIGHFQKIPQHSLFVFQNFT